MKYKIGDSLIATEDYFMSYGMRTFTAGKSYVINDVSHSGYVFIDDTGMEHSMGGDAYVDKYFRKEKTTDNFDYAMGIV